MEQEETDNDDEDSDSSSKGDDGSTDDSPIPEETGNKTLTLSLTGEQVTNYTKGEKGEFKFIIRDDNAKPVKDAQIYINGVLWVDAVSDDKGKVTISDYEFEGTGELSIVFVARHESYLESNEITVICNITKK